MSISFVFLFFLCGCASSTLLLFTEVETHSFFCRTFSFLRSRCKLRWGLWINWGGSCTSSGRRRSTKSAKILLHSLLMKDTAQPGEPKCPARPTWNTKNMLVFFSIAPGSTCQIVLIYHTLLRVKHISPTLAVHMKEYNFLSHQKWIMHAKVTFTLWQNSCSNCKRVNHASKGFWAENYLKVAIICDRFLQPTFYWCEMPIPSWTL